MLLIGIVVGMAIGMAWGTVFYTVANYFLDFTITFPQAFVAGLLFWTTGGAIKSAILKKGVGKIERQIRS